MEFDSNITEFPTMVHRDIYDRIADNTAGSVAARD